MSEIKTKKIEAIDAYNIYCDGVHVAIVGGQQDAPVMLIKQVSESQEEEIKKHVDQMEREANPGKLLTKKRDVKQPPPPPPEEEEDDQ